MKTRSWICFFLVLILTCLAFWLLLPRVKEANTIHILQDGQLLCTVDLSRVTEPETLTTEWNGSRNVITVSPDSIAVTEADCGCQVCVDHGPLVPGGMPIICLPNRLVIRWAEDPVVDAVS